MAWSPARRANARRFEVHHPGDYATLNFNQSRDSTADISDSAGAMAILEAIRKRWPWVKHLFADGAYDRLTLMDKATYLRFVIEIIRRSEQQKGFQVLPRRWVVERTFGWMMRWRRLVRDYEKRIDVSHAMIHVAIGSLLVRRNAHP